MGRLLKNLIVKNSALKFFSLILAIFLWFFVMGEKKAEFSFSDVPLVLINKPAGLVITDRTAEKISLRVSGSRTVLATLSSSTVKATIDLSGVKPGTTTVNDLIDKVKLPNGTKITRISPAEFSLTLEPLVTKKVPVHLNIKGDPQEGYEISHSSVIPEFVEVSLAKSESKELQKVMTAPLDISGAKEDIEKEIALVLTDLDPPRTVSSKKVKVSLSISEKIIERILPNITVEVVNNRYETTVVPSTLPITVKGPYLLVKELSANSVSAYVDLKGMKPGRHTKELEIKLPENITLVEAEPHQLKIKVSKKLQKVEKEIE